MCLVGPSGVPLQDKIVTQTRKGNFIDNNQCWVMTRSCINEWARKQREYPPPRAVPRPNPPSSVYNCHGLTFASRRTIVCDLEIQKILNDDDYTEVNDWRNVLAGDIVIYYANGTGDAEHSGIVIEAHSNMQLCTEIKVLSKWGLTGEMIHSLTACPYPECTCKYFRVTK